MKKNLGITDRIVRFVLIDFLIGSSFMGFDLPATVTNVSFVLSIVLAITVITGYSPVYHLFGWNTRHPDDVNPSASQDE